MRNGIVYTYEQPDEVYADQRVTALDAATGQRIWARDVDASHPVTLFDGGVLTASDTAKSFIALDLATGKERWRTPAKSSAGTLCGPLERGLRAAVDPKAVWGVLSARRGHRPGPPPYAAMP
ncbi:outer membrane protein assembly factor BamB family protein [Streptomyces canus]|uniref:outer membrane protein assembly factor BamB family protein n=1 Tax=Streptomyces canus TaxID=58343 RepID=UPI0032472EC1